MIAGGNHTIVYVGAEQAGGRSNFKSTLSVSPKGLTASSRRKPFAELPQVVPRRSGLALPMGELVADQDA